jgi:membrane-bound inhibitor of C-type lysozyme
MEKLSVEIQGTTYTHGDDVIWSGDNNHDSDSFQNIPGKIYISSTAIYILQDKKFGCAPGPTTIEKYGDWKDMGYKGSWVYIRNESKIIKLKKAVEKSKTKLIDDKTIIIRGITYKHGDDVIWNGNDHGGAKLEDIPGKIYIGKNHFFILQNIKSGSTPYDYVREHNDCKDMGYKYSWAYRINGHYDENIILRPNGETAHDELKTDRTITINGTTYKHGDDILWGGHKNWVIEEKRGKIYIGDCNGFYILQSAHNGSGPVETEIVKYGRMPGYKFSWKYVEGTSAAKSIILKLDKKSEMTTNNTITIKGTTYTHGDDVLWTKGSKKDIKGKIFIAGDVFYILQDRCNGVEPYTDEKEKYGEFPHSYKHAWKFGGGGESVRGIILKLNKRTETTSIGKSDMKHKPTNINFYELRKETTKIAARERRSSNPLQGRRNKIAIGGGQVRDQKTSIKV